jgi:hypothetical protein
MKWSRHCWNNPDFEDMLNFMASGPSLVLLLEHNDEAVGKLHEIYEKTVLNHGYQNDGKL